MGCLEFMVAILGAWSCLMISGCRGEVYKVGDSRGWTTIGKLDYKDWAASKSFRLGDVILFQYDPQFHNVMQVNRFAFRGCNASFPVATHTSGNDSITLGSYGHHLFLCGVPGHCQSGQKVDVKVILPHSDLSAAPPAAASPSHDNDDAKSRGPSHSGADCHAAVLQSIVITVGHAILLTMVSTFLGSFN